MLESTWQRVEKLPLLRSELGFASFVQALVFGGMVGLSFAFCVVSVATGGGQMGPNSSLAMIFGLTILMAMGVGLSGLGLGIAALMQAGRQRTWSILGVLFNGAGLLGMICLIALGIMMDH